MTALVLLLYPRLELARSERLPRILTMNPAGFPQARRVSYRLRPKARGFQLTESLLKDDGNVIPRLHYKDMYQIYFRTLYHNDRWIVLNLMQSLLRFCQLWLSPLNDYLLWLIREQMVTEFYTKKKKDSYLS